MANYFNSLPHRLKVQELGKCDFMQSSEFADGVEFQIWERLALNCKQPIKKWYLNLLAKRL